MLCIWGSVQSAGCTRRCLGAMQSACCTFEYEGVVLSVVCFSIALPALLDWAPGRCTVRHQEACLPASLTL